MGAGDGRVRRTRHRRHPGREVARRPRRRHRPPRRQVALPRPHRPRAPAERSRPGPPDRRRTLRHRQNCAPARRAPLRAIFVAAVLSPALAAEAGAAAPPNRASVAETVVASPDITYQIPFVINCSEATWRKVLDNPWLMGQLWNVYGYSPAYKVSTAGDGLHIDDPTGLVGDLWLVRNGLDERRYFATGRLNFRAVPF